MHGHDAGEYVVLRPAPPNKMRVGVAVVLMVSVLEGDFRQARFATDYSDGFALGLTEELSDAEVVKDCGAAKIAIARVHKAVGCSLGVLLWLHTHTALSGGVDVDRRDWWPINGQGVYGLGRTVFAFCCTMLFGFGLHDRKAGARIALSSIAAHVCDGTGADGDGCVDVRFSCHEEVRAVRGDALVAGTSPWHKMAAVVDVSRWIGGEWKTEAAGTGVAMAVVAAFVRHVLLD